jgi:hypothetical protein
MESQEGCVMDHVIIDAREWQNMFDLKSGKKVKYSSPKVGMVREVLADHPYPGDTDSRSNQWVSDTALDLINRYQPQLACLSYAHQYFSSRYMPMIEAERSDMIRTVFTEVDRFVRISGYAPVIVGTGDMVVLKGEIDLNKLDGLAISSGWSGRYAGLHKPSQKDLKHIKEIPEIEKIVGQKDWITLFGGMSNTTCDIALMPDFLLVAREGWSFKTMGTPLRKVMRISGESYSIPVSTPLGNPEHITHIRNVIEHHLPHEKIALILLEGIGKTHFPIPHISCDNGKDWFFYEPGEGQYLTITTGTHQVFAYPTGYRYFDIDVEKMQFPFSGYFTEIPGHTIGNDFAGKSIAVGNRSMFTHMVFGTDISIECFARNLHNQGCMAVLRDGNN